MNFFKGLFYGKQVNTDCEYEDFDEMGEHSPSSIIIYNDNKPVLFIHRWHADISWRVYLQGCGTFKSYIFEKQGHQIGYYVLKSVDDLQVMKGILCDGHGYFEDGYMLSSGREEISSGYRYLLSMMTIGTIKSIFIQLSFADYERLVSYFDNELQWVEDTK